MDTAGLLDLVKSHTFITVGCTDPVAVSLAVAWAGSVCEGDVRRIRVRADQNVTKDAVRVRIPGVGISGLEMAAAIGFVVGSPHKGLVLLSDVTKKQVEEAYRIVSQGLVVFEVVDGVPGIMVEAEVETDTDLGYARLEGGHDRLVELKRNGRQVEHPLVVRDTGAAPRLDALRSSEVRLDELIDFVDSLQETDLGFLGEGMEVNRRTAEVGMEAKAGLGVGAKLALLSQGQWGIAETISRARALAAAAADARMSGQMTPIMGCFGSGNHGITLFIAMSVLAEHLEASRLRTLRALCLGEVLTGYVKSRTGVLTPHCGCGLAAGVGCAGGAAYLMGGNACAVENAMNLVFATLFGTICDGAKESCSLKIANAAGVALESAYLAAELGASVRSEGMLGATFAETLSNVEYLTKTGYAAVDPAILGVLLDYEIEKGEKAQS